MAQDTYKEWTYINKIDRLPAAAYVHVDTRDFHLLCSDSAESPKMKDLLKAVRNRCRQDSWKFRRDEILGTLATLEAGSGGPGEWRMLTIKKVNWLKYIRFVKTDEEVDLGNRKEPVYVAYADDCGRFIQLGREDLVPEALNLEHLNHIPHIPGREVPDDATEVIECKTLEDVQQALDGAPM